MKQSSLFNYFTPTPDSSSTSNVLLTSGRSGTNKLPSTGSTSPSSSAYSQLHPETLLLTSSSLTCVPSSLLNVTSPNYPTSSKSNLLVSTQQPQLHLVNDAPRQPINVNFPKTKFGPRERSFSTTWYSGRQWLEYSVADDAAFCYCCRPFGSPGATGETTFKASGYRNWKSALDKGKGFHKHETSHEHVQCMKRWKEMQIRKERGEEVSTLVNDSQLKKNVIMYPQLWTL